MNERTIAAAIGYTCYANSITLAKTMIIADAVAIAIGSKLSTTTWYDIARKAWKQAKADKLERWKRGEYHERS